MGARIQAGDTKSPTRTADRTSAAPSTAAPEVLPLRVVGGGYFCPARLQVPSRWAGSCFGHHVQMGVCQMLPPQCLAQICDLSHLHLTSTYMCLPWPCQLVRPLSIPSHPISVNLSCHTSCRLSPLTLPPQPLLSVLTSRQRAWRPAASASAFTTERADQLAVSPPPTCDSRPCRSLVTILGTRRQAPALLLQQASTTDDASVTITK